LDLTQKCHDLLSTKSLLRHDKTPFPRQFLTIRLVQKGPVRSYLSEIPVLGGLFGTKSNDTTRTELIVLLTPHVIDNLQKARAVTDELKRKLPGLKTLLEKP
ncbi:MAG: hypothetical protein JSR60_16985, partial [Proteobacteria bacterium]|nr:hypothetical protein [Pseudomonadota bacterium]